MKTAVETEHAMAPKRAGDPKGQALLREAISASACGYGAAARRLQAVWRKHKRTGLHETLRALVEMVGQLEAIAIRRRAALVGGGRFGA